MELTGISSTTERSRMAIILIFLFSLSFLANSQEVLIDLEMNPLLFSKKKVVEKSIANNQEYYLLDTLNLPFIDDFSTNKLKRYYNWEYPAPFDSMAIHWTANGDTLPSINVSLDTTWHYYYKLDTTSSDTFLVDLSRATLDSTVMITPYYEVVYHNGANPFIPNETVYYWLPVDSFTIYDTLAVTIIDTSLITPDTTLTNSNDTVIVYLPDTHSLWLDNYAFINSTYPIYPPSIGVATLDGVDEIGMPYEFVVGLPHGVADYLTSKPVNLAPYQPSDSLYFSFYYQPQGRGNAPESNDLLALQFKTSTLDWTDIWSMAGSALPADSMFKQVMIAVTDTVWFKNDFQFRFMNYATLSGNVDHWHIDYVRFSNARTFADTVYEDVAYVYPAYSLLNNFQAMPWSHFLVEPAYFMNDTLLLTFHNNMNAVQNTGYRWKVFDENNIEIFDKNGGSKNFAASVFCENKGTGCDPTDFLPMSPDFAFTFPDNGNDSAEYEIVTSLATNPDNIKTNDTLHYTQVFHNYYAYDDGTAENGYGLEIQSPVGVSMAAYRFSMIKQDTLRGVRFYFNPQLEDVSQKYFNLMVWTGNETPGTVVYRRDSVSPHYSPGLNYFRTYNINDTVLILPAGNFFVGWMQLSNYRMNVGFDRNLNANSTMFYNLLGGGWIQSQLPGAWMIRPVFYQDTLPLDVFSIKENTIMTEFSIFPNPATDDVYIVHLNETGNSNDYMLNIFNNTGGLVKTLSSLPRSVSISDLAQGFYFINITNKETQAHKTYKLIISR